MKIIAAILILACAALTGCISIEPITGVGVSLTVTKFRYEPPARLVVGVEAAAEFKPLQALDGIWKGIEE